MTTFASCWTKGSAGRGAATQEFEEEHLPGAVNVPLKWLDEKTTRQIDPSRPVIVYCWDYQ